MDEDGNIGLNVGWKGDKHNKERKCKECINGRQIEGIIKTRGEEDERMQNK